MDALNRLLGRKNAPAADDGSEMSDMPTGLPVAEVPTSPTPPDIEYIVSAHNLAESKKLLNWGAWGKTHAWGNVIIFTIAIGLQCFSQYMLMKHMKTLKTLSSVSTPPPNTTLTTYMQNMENYIKWSAISTYTLYGGLLAMYILARTETPLHGKVGGRIVGSVVAVGCFGISLYVLLAKTRKID